MLGLEHHPGHDEQEDAQIGQSDQGILVATEIDEVVPQPGQNLVGVEQADRTQDAQETKALASDWREEREDRRKVGD
ncbi:hypothetical protein MesoLjLc_42370 [Mesorhizobium sp. L-8-10]|nr:hypothetical protein MesoLjLb_43690 [Mesorhizobium sp. L-8-3]BCH32307.1 hypothetical protein MesoLjLc_42370 [Mesorhizobium sp. L-8-10]